MWVELANKLVKVNESCLFEAIHAALYFKVYKTVGGDWGVVAWIVPHFLRNHIWEDADVLVIFYGRTKVEFFDVNSEVAGTCLGIGDGAIYVDLDIKNAHGRRSGIDGLV